MIAPILLFTYKRLDTLKYTIESLRKNSLAAESTLFIYSDGPKALEDEEKVDGVRDYLDTINGFQKIEVIKSTKNKGLANSIIDGVTSVLTHHDSVIVLEDDLVLASDFLMYMNKCLDYYSDNPSVISVSGYCPPFKIPKTYKYDVFLTKRSTSWGWATWRDKWCTINWDISDYSQFSKDKVALREFKKLGTDLLKMLDDQYNSNIDSWAIRFVYNQFKNNMLSVFPVKSYVKNIGFGKDATHTKTSLRQREIDLSEKVEFIDRFQFCNLVDPMILRNFESYYNTRNRLLRKLATLLK